MVKCRIWAITLLIVFMAVMPAGAVSAATPFTDIAGTDCEEAVTVLSALGLVEGRVADMFTPYANMTRGEMATVLIRFMDLETDTGGGTVFSDVPASHWASGNIEAAYGMGIVKGMGDGKFAPDAEVTYTQAIKMFICALGYEVHAEADGGYPSGYMAKASQLGLLKGVSASGADAVITRSDMAILMYNMLEIPLLAQTSYGEGASGQYTEEEDTLLSRYRGIYVAEGMVDADYYTEIKTPNSKVDRDSIAIDGAVYNAARVYDADLLGYNVKAYYEIPDTAETRTILYVAPVSGSASVTVNSGDISEETSKTNIEYEENGADKSFAVDDGAMLVLNGIVKDEWTAADLSPERGTVTAIDNRGADDVIKVNSYINYVVKGKNLNDKTVYFKEAVNGTDSMVLDSTDTSVKLLITDNTGAETDIDAFSEWDILSVAKSADGTVIKAVKSSDKVTGKVLESSDDEVLIGEVTYNVDSNLPNGSLTAPELNQTADFCLDFMGNIAAVNTSTGSIYKYGYLLGAANKKGIDGTGQFKVFTEDGAMILFDAANTVILNGYSYKANEVVAAIPERDLFYSQADEYEKPGNVVAMYYKTGTTIEQLIKFRASEDGTQLLEIMTATDATHMDPADMAGDAGFNKVLEANQSTWRVQSSVDKWGNPTGSKEVKSKDGIGYVGGKSSAFCGQYGIKSSTKIFVIPKNTEDDSKFEIMTGLSHGANYYGTSLYDLSEGHVAGAMVWDKGVYFGALPETDDDATAKTVKYAEDYADGGYGMVVGVSKASIIDEYGERVEVTKVAIRTQGNGDDSAMVREDYAFGYSIANTVSDDPYKTSPEKYILAEELQYGDIIQYSKDNDGYFDIAFVLIRAATPGLYELGTWGDDPMVNTVDKFYQGGTYVSTGKIANVTADNIVVKTRLANRAGQPADDEITRILPTAADSFIEVDLSAKSYRTISYEEVMPEDIYATVWEASNPRFFIIYK